MRYRFEVWQSDGDLLIRVVRLIENHEVGFVAVELDAKRFAIQCSLLLSLDYHVLKEYDLKTKCFFGTPPVDLDIADQIRLVSYHPDAVVWTRLWSLARCFLALTCHNNGGGAFFVASRFHSKVDSSRRSLGEGASFKFHPPPREGGSQI